MAIKPDNNIMPITNIMNTVLSSTMGLFFIYPYRESV